MAAVTQKCLCAKRAISPSYHLDTCEGQHPALCQSDSITHIRAVLVAVFVSLSLP